MNNTAHFSGAMEQVWSQTVATRNQRNLAKDTRMTVRHLLIIQR